MCPNDNTGGGFKKHKQHADRISLFPFIGNKEERLNNETRNNLLK
jgi:hypothetical protein